MGRKAPADRIQPGVGSHTKTDTMKIKNAYLLFLLLYSTGFLFGQSNIDTEYEVSLKALAAIRGNDIGAFKALMDENILTTIQDESLVNYLNSASAIVRKHDRIAPKEFVLLETSSANYQNINISIVSLIFPFPAPNKRELISDQQIIFLFSDDIQKGKIIGYRIRDFAGPAKEIEEEAKKKPHLYKFNLKAEQIGWFRIWYDKGPAKNDLGNKSGVYALSGDKNMLKKAQINMLFSEILNLINTAKIDNADINNSLTKTVGSPEYLHIRMTFDCQEYKNLGEFSIFTILKEEEGIDEINKEFIIIRYSGTHRYFLKISENSRLWEKLKELAHIDHGKLLETNP